MWILRYYRYKVLEEHEADTKEEALRFGVYGSEYGELYMHELVDPQGNVVMDSEQLGVYWSEQKDI